MKKHEFFKTPIWYEQKPDFVKSLDKASDKYIKEARKRNNTHTKKYGDFGIPYHSTPLFHDNDFLDFRNYVGQRSWEFLDSHGYDMKQYKTMFSEMWVQEFSKKGGAHHSAHIHGNQHVSGFYFLKAGEKTSFPIFHDPRTGARATKLNMKPEVLKNIENGNDLIHFRPQPGVLLIFPGYLEHEFALDYGIKPFRFIHWNIQAVPKEMARDA